MVDEINSGRRQRVVDLAATLLGDLSGKRIALWGAAFKPGTDDVRDSPALDVADRLARLGAQVVVYDPQAAGNALVAFPHLDQANSPLAAARDANAVLVGTAWPQFAAADPPPSPASSPIRSSSTPARESRPIDGGRRAGRWPPRSRLPTMVSNGPGWLTTPHATPTPPRPPRGGPPSLTATAASGQAATS